MKTIAKLAAVSFAALVAVGFADAQVTKQGNGYLLRMKFTPGQTSKFNIAMDTSAAGQSMKMAMPMTQKVVSVKNGVADLTMNVGPMSMNGKPMNTQVQTINVSMDSTGKVVKGAPMGQTGTQVSLPEKPVKVGESWTVNTKTQAGMGGNMDVKATYTLAGFQTVAGKQMAKLNVKMSAGGQMTMKGDGTMLLLMTDGSLHTANLKMNMTMPQPQGQGAQGGQPMNIVTNMTIKRA